MSSLAAPCLYETLDFAFSTPSAPSSPYTVYRNEITDVADPAPAAVPLVEYFSLLPSPPDTPCAADGEVSPVVSSPGPVAGGGDGGDGVETNRPWFRAGSRIRSPMLQLHKEIIDFVEFVSPTPEEQASRTAAVQSVSEVIKYIWPHCIVEVFGSFRAGLYLPTSDIDVVILESKVTKPQTGLYALARALSQRSIAKKMQVIAKARVPIVKFVEKRSGIAFDISFDIENGPKAADFIKDALKKIPPLRPLCMLLKVFLQQRELNEVYSGGIGSYALLAMLIANLQTYRSPQDLQLRRQPMEHNLGILLVNFFEFYGRKLNTTDVGVSCNSAGTFFLKTDKGFFNTERPYLLSIEDPQAPENDIGKSSFNYYKVRSAFQMAYSSLTNAKAILGFEHHRGILGTIIRPDPVLLDRRGGSNGELTFDQLLPGAGEPVMPQIVKGQDLVCNWQLVDDDEPLPREKIVPEDNHVSSWSRRRLLKVKKDITSDRYEENGVVKESSVKKNKRKAFRDEDGIDNGRHPRYLSRSR